MLEITRLGGGSDPIELDFVEREATPEPAMRLDIRAHLAGLSLSNTVRLLAFLGVDRCRTTVHNWVQKAELEPAGGCSPEQIALDETVIKVNGERFWIYAAVDPATNRILHCRLFTTRNLALTKRFLRELDQKHDVNDTEFLVDGAPWLQAGLHELGMHFRHKTFGERNPVERVFQEVKRRTEQFYNCFSNAQPETVESWL
jgi:transposase-like protein